MMLRKFFLFLLFAFFSCLTIFAKEYSFGLYITDIYNFDQVNQTFQADLWLWINYFGDEVDFNGTLDFINSLDETQKNYQSEHFSDLNRNYMQQKFTGTFRCEWNLRRFPFDKNVLSLEIEDFRPIEEINFVPDYENSMIDSSIAFNEWDISPLYIDARPFTYDSNFGDFSAPDKKSSYSRIVASVTVSRRTPWITFFKLTFGVYIAFVLSVISFAIRPETDSRLSLPCAALFAVGSNKYVVESVVPSSVNLTMLDSIHIITMLCILLICVVVIKTDGLRSSGDTVKVKKSFLIDKVFALVICLVYATFNVWALVPYN